MYMSSCVDVVPIVVSVPKQTKCRSGVDTKVSIDAVGQLATIVALVDVALVASEFHSNVAPSTMVAISLFPKLSKVHTPGAVIISPVCDAPHFVKSDAFLTVAPSECDAAVVLSDPLVSPPKVSVPEVLSALGVQEVDSSIFS